MRALLPVLALAAGLAVACVASPRMAAERARAPIYAVAAEPAASATGQVAQPSALATRRIPAPLRGITLDSVAALPEVLDAVEHLARRPTIRIVFDPGTEPADYAEAIRALRPHAYLMAELVDSTAFRRTTRAQMVARARKFAGAFAGQIDIWEIGNELNGAWLGADPQAINDKVLAVHRVIAGEYHLRTAITLNYWSGPGCIEHPWERTLPFARGMPAQVRAETRIVLLSVYETACSPPQRPSAAELAGTLQRLGRLFPSARLGIGEIGAQRRSDGLPDDPSLAEKQRVARTYYGMHDALRLQLGSRFVGGYFWWYFREDAVPRTRAQSLWPELDRLLAGLPDG
ncbi:hypothetical protein [Novosphingobium huizhouense]|uniref:hypothetical protein n=1 Tax=Novosphingobium huizhouense TaxID=2866625 RepID=UPI001CD8453B|nr:hypothetical protein [Novosphingobium huizhouense]